MRQMHRSYHDDDDYHEDDLMFYGNPKEDEGWHWSDFLPNWPLGYWIIGCFSIDIVFLYFLLW